MINLRWLQKEGSIFQILQYEGTGDAVSIKSASDAPPDALIAMRSDGLVYYLSEWKDVPTVKEPPTNNSLNIPEREQKGEKW